MSDGPPPDYVLEEQVGHLMRRAYQRHLALFQGIMGEDGPTSMQFAALVTLWRRGPLSQNAAWWSGGAMRATRGCCGWR